MIEPVAEYLPSLWAARTVVAPPTDPITPMPPMTGMTGTGCTIGAVRLLLISFLTLSSIYLKIYTSFLACILSAFSLRISIFSILW